jgi:phosphate-starvation-inducible protein E
MSLPTLDLSSTDAFQLLAVAAAILALGAVYWLVRGRERPRDARPIRQRAIW